MKIDLIHGDCLEKMKDIPDGSIDCVVTDPPFGIGFKYGDKKDVANTANEYWKWFNPIYNEIIRVTRKGGFIAIWQAQLYFRYFWNWYGEGIHIYAGCKNFVQLRKTPINYGYDPIVMLYISGAELLRPIKPKRNIDYFVANTASMVSDTKRIERQHPCPRPIDQVTQIVENFSVGKVLDPFMGSGTTGVVCKNLNRDFIGIEIDETYFKMAEERIKNTPEKLF